MTRKLLILAAVALLLPAATAMAFHPSKNCDTCHVVHMANDGDGMPLWSGKGSDHAPTFVNYTSDKMDAAPGDPTGSTLLCLSCHDGVGTPENHLIVHTDGQEGNLSRSHPIEFVYDAALALADKELVDPNTPGSSSLPAGKGTIKDDLLWDYKMKCTSCHEIHENGLDSQTFDQGTPEIGDDVTYDIPHLQPIVGVVWEYSPGHGPNPVPSYSLRYGALCTTCHIK